MLRVGSCPGCPPPSCVPTSSWFSYFADLSAFILDKVDTDEQEVTEFKHCTVLRIRIGVGIRILKKLNIDLNHQKIIQKISERTFFLFKKYNMAILYFYIIWSWSKNLVSTLKGIKITKKTWNFSILGQIQAVSGSGAKLLLYY